MLQALLPHLSASNHNTMLFALGVLMNFISDHREPMLNAASPLRKQYKPILEGLGESANEQLRLFSQMALAQLKRGVETREEFYATKIEALFRGRKARSELGARRWRVVTDRIANELAWEVVEELAQPTITWGVGYASVVVSATINVQAGARRQLAKIHAIEARHHRLKVHDVCEDVCDELFDRIISSFVKPMCGTLLAESRLEFALPAAAAEAAMRAAASGGGEAGRRGARAAVTRVAGKEGGGLWRRRRRASRRRLRTGWQRLSWPSRGSSGYRSRMITRRPMTLRSWCIRQGSKTSSSRGSSRLQPALAPLRRRPLLSRR